VMHLEAQSGEPEEVRLYVLVSSEGWMGMSVGGVTIPLCRVIELLV
jgi:hypothetical protein